MKTCRKMICLLLSISLLACMVIPASATEIAEENRTTAPANRVLEAIETQLLNYYECMDLFGYEERSFSDLSVGDAIYAYEYQDETFCLLDFLYYPVFSGVSLMGLAIVREIDGRITAQFEPSFASMLNDVTSEIAIVFDRDSCYVYSEENGFVKLYGFSSVSERDSLGFKAQADTDLIQVAAMDGPYRSIQPDLNNDRAASTCAVLDVTSLRTPVSVVLQGSYNNLCWAASAACIGNYKTSSTCTAAQVAQSYFGTTNFNQSLFGYQAIPVMNSFYSLDYSYQFGCNSTAIHNSLAADRLVFAAAFYDIQSSHHAVVIFYINYATNAFGIMDPDSGFRYGDLSTFTYTASNGYSYCVEGYAT